MRHTIMLGTSKVEITPKHSIPLAGFKDRGGPFVGISHPLYLRVLFFQLKERDGSWIRSIITSADLIWWDSRRAQQLRKEIACKFGMQESSFILHATHTHSGPQTSEQFTPSLGIVDPSYMEYLEERLLQGIEQASRNVESVIMERGSGVSSIGIHRRKVINGQIVMAPNSDGPTDPEVTVIAFRTESKRIKAVITHYTCHPTTTGDNFVSSEYAGVAMDRIEGQYGGDTVALFLQGCCGDVRPALVQEEAFYRGTDQEVRRLGRLLADGVISVLDRPMQQMQPSIGSRSITCSLPFRSLPSLVELKELAQQNGVLGEWSTLLLLQSERLVSEIPIEIIYLEVADGLAFLAMNGEVVVEYGLWIKRVFAKNVLPIPYSNGMIGYIPTAKQIEEGGYEVEESTLYFGLPAPFSAEIEERIKESVIRLVGEEAHHVKACED